MARRKTRAPAPDMVNFATLRRVLYQVATSKLAPDFVVTWFAAEQLCSLTFQEIWMAEDFAGELSRRSSTPKFHAIQLTMISADEIMVLQNFPDAK
jgi:hypothetical protein